MQRNARARENEPRRTSPQGNSGRWGNITRRHSYQLPFASKSFSRSLNLSFPSPGNPTIYKNRLGKKLGFLLGFLRIAMASDRALGGVALSNPPPHVSQTARTLDLGRRNAETSAAATILEPVSSLSPLDATVARRKLDHVHLHDNASADILDVSKAGAATNGLGHGYSPSLIGVYPQSSYERDDRSLQSQSQSNPDSQDTSTTSQVFTPPESDSSAGVPPSDAGPGPSSQDSQLHQLSEIAAAQDKMAIDGGTSRKRMADGVVKARRGSMSPVKGHSRNTSTVSRASTTGSNIGEVRMIQPARSWGCRSTNTLQLSAELRTRLSYAMVKVNHGWQSHSLDEVESLASHAASPASSTSTVHRRKSLSASPRHAITTTITRVPVTHDERRGSGSPPFISSNKPTLAPPAPIQPSTAMPAPRSHPRRTSIRNTPTFLSNSNSISPHSPALQASQARPEGPPDPMIISPHQNVREQDAIETLLFMSSPGNSANLKHAFSPRQSPGPLLQGMSARHALPSGPRKVLPSQRTAGPRKVNFDKSPGGMVTPNSPMDLDSPQQPYHTPNRGTPRRRMNGSGHIRGALSLPSGLGLGNGVKRKILRDEDIERMLDQAGAEPDSSDDEEIQIPRNRGAVASTVKA